MKSSEVVAIDADAGRTVQRVLHDRIGLSNARLQGLIEAGLVRRNGRCVRRPDERVIPGDKLRLSYDPARRYRPAPGPKTERGYRVVHEDEHLVVVDKEAGLITVPAPSHRGESLRELLDEVYRRRGFRNASVHVVHRIDRFTSGLVVFARTGAAHSALRAQFRSGQPERVYLAVTEGVVDPPAGRLVHHLAEHAKSLKVQVVAAGPLGRPAACTYRTLERFEGASLVQVRLETGRRNQIRVQFAAIGHSLEGDPTYGEPSSRIDRTALHAFRLGFEHPAGGRRLRFESKPPADFTRLLRRLRAGVETPAPRPGVRT